MVKIKDGSLSLVQVIEMKLKMGLLQESIVVNLTMMIHVSFVKLIIQSLWMI